MSDKQISVLLTDNENIQALNKQFRGVDSPTDVLSFPGDGFSHTPLGDIAISIPTALQQAQSRELTLEQELAYLAIHGALHLLGFDDETPEQYEDMIHRMNVIAEKAGLSYGKEWNSIY